MKNNCPSFSGIEYRVNRFKMLILEFLLLIVNMDATTTYICGNQKIIIKIGFSNISFESNVSPPVHIYTR